MRKVLYAILSMIIAISGVTLYSDFASANQDLKSKINQVQGKRANLKQDSKNKQNLVNQIENEEVRVNNEIKRLDLAVAETAENIRQKEADIKRTQAEIDKLTAEIIELQERIKKRDEALKTRVLTVQETGGVVSYLDVLLGSKSFGDFLNRVNAVSTIVEQDKEILRSHVTDKESLEEIKIEAENKKSQLEQKKATLEKDRKTLIAQKAEKEQLMEELKEREEQIEAEILSLQEQDEILAKQEAAYKKMYQQWLEQQEAIKRGEKPPVTDGTFMRPATGPVTSNYGKRWGKLHAGIDIGKRGSDVPIVAAADGIVFRSYYSSSYGNVVFLSHNLNGKMYTTVYAHMESRKVSEGDTISKGQLIGYMGNTGQSYGAHLHFEIHEGPWNYEKSNSVDPKKYVNF
ncbi:murein hydrolase activator EnvC family protein [Calidifontibacillus oryziterrae]|uniref:murein hydrolase activator EnvC family protein n=1 Tax=Calidifontibacillus oryziterrae TaxID=1191699 RepID=UPI0003021F64|nr:M23 family metallopeptidase [Calidifontibacillus oryziterrae]